MSRVKDLWWSKVPRKDTDGNNVLDEHGRVEHVRRMSAKHPDRGGSKAAKRYLAVWKDPDGNEKTEAFGVKDDAARYAARMEADADRGEYLDPNAARDLFGPLAEKHMRLRRKRDGSRIGESTRIRTMSVYRNHVEPVFARRAIRAVKASDIGDWLDGDLSKMSVGVQECAYHIVAGTFDLAVDNKVRRDNPARAKSIHPPKGKKMTRKAWPVERALEVRDELPEPYRLVADFGAALGARQGEAFALSPDDFDREAGTVSIVRQVRRVGTQMVFKLPKGGKTRTVPLPRGLAAAVGNHAAKYPPLEVTLPWMNEDGTLGEEVTVPLLLTWRPSKWKRTAGQPLAAGNFSTEVWKPVLSYLGILPPPVKTANRTLVYRVGDAAHNGMHALRHVYEGMLGDGGVSLAGQVEFLGHSKESQGVTIGVYGNVTSETFEQGRRAVDARLYKLRVAGAKNETSGTVAEFRAAR